MFVLVHGATGWGHLFTHHLPEESLAHLDSTSE